MNPTALAIEGTSMSTRLKHKVHLKRRNKQAWRRCLRIGMPSCMPQETASWTHPPRCMAKWMHGWLD
eukprot:10558983-Alexandrium_andersonii.AAC.1